MKTQTKKTASTFLAGSLTGNTVFTNHQGNKRVLTVFYLFTATHVRKLHLSTFFKSFFDFSDDCTADLMADKNCTKRYYQQNLFM
ncbi:MAG TPA: hypothetical protein VGN20_11600 [Mucilaginibacter sp.]|jgi:hypothetical protein